MASIPFNSLLQQASTGDTVRDYQHASRLFVDSLYRLSPKATFLFHVFIDINPYVTTIGNNEQIELGMLAKSAQLPKFTIKNKIYNSYNRKNVVQDAIQYDPLTFSFHDDSADIVRGFWGDYYSYYYRDGDYPEPVYKQGHKYQNRQYQYWGFSPKNDVPYISFIRLYSLHQNHFSAYTLINPMITSFKHGDHQYSENGTMQHDMTIAYEGVHYLTGPVSEQTVQGFSMIHYDNTPSPLSGGPTDLNIGSSGLIQNSTNSPVTNLSNQGGSLFSNTPNTQYASLGQAGGGMQSASAGLVAALTQSVLAGQNTQSTVYAPTSATIAGAFANASAPIPSALSVPGSILNINNQNSTGY